MKRVRIAKKKFVTVSSQIMEKAARAFSKAPTAEQVSDLATSEPPLASGAMFGIVKSPKASRPTAATADRRLTASKAKPCLVGQRAQQLRGKK